MITTETKIRVYKRNYEKTSPKCDDILIVKSDMLSEFVNITFAVGETVQVSASALKVAIENAINR